MALGAVLGEQTDAGLLAAPLREPFAVQQNSVKFHSACCIPSVPADRSPLDLDWSIDGEPARPKIAEAWFMTYPFNMLAQLPVLNVPIGLAASGVPLGMQVVGPTYDDAAPFALAAALETARRSSAWPA